MNRLRAEQGYAQVSLLCTLFGKTKQAYYKYEDRSMEYLAQERFVLEYVKQVRAKDPGIGGEKLWLMYCRSFGEEYAVGRDRFCAVLSKYGLNLRHRPNHPRTTDSRHNLPKYPDLTRTLLIVRPNQLWVSDITYIVIWTDDEHYIFCYLSLITDVYTKEIIGYCVGDTLESVYTVNALKMALNRMNGAPVEELIHHSDRGVQYASVEYISHLRQAHIQVSMTETGNPKDNAVAERVNGIIKRELLKGICFHDIKQVRQTVKTAIEFYNNERPHMSLDMMTPAQAAEGNGTIKKRWVSYREKYLSAE